MGQVLFLKPLSNLHDATLRRERQGQLAYRYEEGGALSLPQDLSASVGPARHRQVLQATQIGKGGSTHARHHAGIEDE